MEIHAYDKPVFRISVVADLLGIHPQTLRRYEQLKLVAPHRAASNSRLFSRKDLDDIREIRKLTQPPHSVGVEGVRLILQLRADVRRLQNRIEELEKSGGPGSGDEGQGKD